MAAIAVVVLPHRAFDFGMELMANQDTLAACAAEADDFQVHLGHQGAGGIENLEAALLCLFLHGLRNTVGTEDHDGRTPCRIERRNVCQLIHEDRAALPQCVHHKLVVDHFVTHVDRRAIDVQRPVDDVDGAVHPGAEAAGIGELDLGRRGPLRRCDMLHDSHQRISMTCTPWGMTARTCALNRISRPASG